MYDFQRKHGHDIDCHVLAPASTCSNTRASTFVTTRASTCITTRASMVLNGASTCSNTCASTCITTRASTCITTRASTCHYTRARLLFKNMPPGGHYQVKVCGEHESNRQTNRGQSGPNLGPGFKACSKSAGSNSQHSFHMI